LIDCALNAGDILVTSNIKDFEKARIQETLAERESVPPQEGLSPEVIDRLKRRVKERGKRRA